MALRVGGHFLFSRVATVSYGVDVLQSQYLQGAVDLDAAVGIELGCVCNFRHSFFEAAGYVGAVYSVFLRGGLPRGFFSPIHRQVRQVDLPEN